jgi:hypothetical protein
MNNKLLHKKETDAERVAGAAVLLADAVALLRQASAGRRPVGLYSVIIEVEAARLSVAHAAAVLSDGVAQ